MAKNETERIENYHRIANVALRTLATMLTIIFAYTFSAREIPEPMVWIIVGLTLAILIGIIFSIASLFGQRHGEMRYIEWGAKISISIMIVVLALMVLFLAWLLTSKILGSRS